MPLSNIRESQNNEYCAKSPYLNEVSSTSHKMYRYFSKKMSYQLQVSLQRLHASLNHFETHSKCFSSRIFELRSSSMQFYHRLVKRIP